MVFYCCSLRILRPHNFNYLPTSGMVNGSAMGLLLHNKRSFVLFLRCLVALVTTTKTSSSTSIAADLGLQSSLFCLCFADLYSEKQGSSAFWVGMEHNSLHHTTTWRRSQLNWDCWWTRSGHEERGALLLTFYSRVVQNKKGTRLLVDWSYRNWFSKSPENNALKEGSFFLLVRALPAPKVRVRVSFFRWWWS